MDYRIFRGATRPPMFLGVPLTSFLILAVTTLAPIALLLVARMFVLCALLPVIFVIGYFWMRTISKRDPWRVGHEILRFRIRIRKSGNPHIWGGVSYRPFQLRQARFGR